MGKSTEVQRWLNDFDHPLKDAITRLREVILQSDTRVEECLPIRLTPMTATCRVPPLPRVKLGIGWSRGVARDAEQ